MLTYARLAALQRAGAKTGAWRRVGGGRLTEGRGRREGAEMRISSNRAEGYGGVSSLTAVIVIDYENKGLSQEHMLCLPQSEER